MGKFICISTIFFCIAISHGKEVGTIIPLYSYPKTDNGGNAWKPLLDAYKKFPIETWAIINVDSGPGSTKDPQYATAVANLKSVGIKTLGYVSTNYTKRNRTVILKDIDLWSTWYSPAGIFLDEMTNDNVSSHIQFYKSLDTYCKNHGYTFTVGNPGTNVSPEYFDAVDTTMIYESPRFPQAKTICPKKSPDTSAMGIFPYGVAKLNVSAILKAKECVGYIYVTDDGGNNPWDTLPKYLTKLFEILSR